MSLYKLINTLSIVWIGFILTMLLMQNINITERQVILVGIIFITSAAIGFLFSLGQAIETYYTNRKR